MRIAGVNIPEDKRLIISITYVYGIGPKRAADVCAKVKIDPSKRVKDLTVKEQDALRDAVSEYVLDSDLRREISQNIKRLQDIGSARGFRHRRRLPVRGQRTKTNARTRKGRKGMAVAKKKVAAK